MPIPADHMTVIPATKVVTPHGVVGPAEVRVGDGRILGITPVDDAPPRLLAPGFIDLQVNGYAGVDVGHATGDDWGRLGRSLLEGGVTAYCPTLVTRPVADYPERLDEITCAQAAEHASPGSRILGAHLEGPFIAPEFARAHPSEHIRPVDLDWLTGLPAIVRIVTLAPELVGADRAIELLAQRGVLVALGHSGADELAVRSAIERGARLTTHLFNAMPPLDHHRAGLAAIALTDPRMSVSLIADGIHVDDTGLRLVLGATLPDRLALVSDSTAWADGRTRRGTRLVDGAPRLADGTLAGSALRMNEAVARCIELGAPLVSAVAAASSVPARLLGLPDHGRIEPGAMADLVALDDDFSVEEVWVGGVPALNRRP